MNIIKRFETVSQYNIFNNTETLHPLVSIIDMSKADPRSASSMYFGFYVVFLKEVQCGDLRYGKALYDYQEGTLVFIAPGQIITVENPGEVYQPKGHALVFHPDLIRGTSLGKVIHEYNFFGYWSNEALHISERERVMVIDSFEKIKHELGHAIDKHSKKLIADNIELLLNYCVRFYDRQFITRENVNSSIIQRLDQILNQHFNSDDLKADGLPSVAYCAQMLNLSANYFGDLVRKETGQGAKEYINGKLVDLAKERVFDHSRSISEIAHELGFKYPQHFSRFFKQHVGVTPNEYRSMN